MARPRTPEHIHLRSARMLDVVGGELVAPGDLLIGGDRILEVAPTSVPDDAVEIDLGDLTLLPGLMDMEVNLLLGGPDHRSPLNAVQDDPALRTLRAVANARRTLRAGFTTVRNLGLFIQTGGLLLDVALKKAIDFGWFEGPRDRPGRPRHHPDRWPSRSDHVPGASPRTSCPSPWRRASPTASSEVRKAVRYQIKYGAELIKVCASGGVMSHTGPAGAQQYSDEELRAIVDEAHRAGLRVAAHAHGDDGIRAAIEAGIDCIEHGSLMTDETLDLLRRARPVPRADHLPGRRHGCVACTARAPGQGGRGVPPGQGDHPQGHRPGGPHRLWYRRTGHPPREERQGAVGPGGPGHDPARRPSGRPPRWPPSSSTSTTGGASSRASWPT